MQQKFVPYQPRIEQPSFQPPPFVGPEDIGGADFPQAPGFGTEEAEFQPSKFYSFSEGDYQQLESQLFNQLMSRVRGEAGFSGTAGGSAHARGTVQAGAQAQQQRLALQAGEQQRRTSFEQGEALREWQQAESATMMGLQQYQVKMQEASERRQWLWETSMMQHQDYWAQLNFSLQSLLMPFQAVKYQPLNLMAPEF